MKAIIIGGGIAGLTLARGLQLLDWEVSIFEQTPKSEPAGAGIVLSANALKALQALNLYEAVLEAGNPLEHFSILNAAGKMLTSTNHQLLSRQFGHLSALTIHRADLQQSLLHQLSPLQPHHGKKLKSIRQTHDSVQAVFSDDSTMHADFVFGCDGIHSAVRKAVFAEEDQGTRFAGYTCWRGVTKPGLTTVPPQHATESWGKGRRFGIVPLKEGRVYWFACQNTLQSHDPTWSGKSLNDLKELFSDFHSPVQEILAATPPDALLQNDISDLRSLTSYTKGRVVLLGDAAHATTPNMGQGACMAMEDAATLSDLLRKHPYEQAFTEYNRLRIPRTQQIVKRSWQLGKLAQWENPLAVRVRDMLMSSVPAEINQRQLQSLLNVQFDRIQIKE